MLMNGRERIFVAGADTLIGAAIVRRLRIVGACELVGLESREPDYTDAAAVDYFFTATRPQQVYVAAGQSGGILANQRYPARLMHDNLLAAANLIDAAHRHRVDKLLYLGSSCCYPRQCDQPMRVDQLFTSPLEPTNEAYALAKLAGIKLCQSYRRQYGCRFIAAIPANGFGPGDHFNAEDSHVIPALIQRFHQAYANGEPTVNVWGTGQAQRVRFLPTVWLTPAAKPPYATTTRMNPSTLAAAMPFPSVNWSRSSVMLSDTPAPSVSMLPSPMALCPLRSLLG